MQTDPYGKRAKEQTAQNRDPKRKRYDAEIDVNGGELGKAAGMKANDKSTAGVGEHATDCSSEQSHSQIFNRKLPKEFSLGGANRNSHCNFARAGRIPCQQQICNVGAGNE